MKKALSILILLIITVSIFSGCGTNQEKIQKEFLVMLEETATEESIDDIEKFLDKYLSKMELEYASNMVVSYEDYVLSFDNDMIDYNQWANKYEKDIDPALTSLYRIKAFEQENPMARDTVLQITWAELLERAYDLEKLISENKDKDVIREDATWMYGNYINAIIMGTNGTPTFDYKTYEFSKEAKNSYVDFIREYPGTTTAWVLVEYYTYLNSIDYRMDYNNKVSSKSFFDTCDWLVSEAGKRVYQ